MSYLDDLSEALFEIADNPDLTHTEWREAVDNKIRELIDKYREEGK